MTAEETINVLKEQYNRNLRKQLVQALLKDEKENLASAQSGHFINQIFSYVLKNANWNITHSSDEWDDKPLSIMKEVFPKIETTTWYKDKKLSTDKNIDVFVGE